MPTLVIRNIEPDLHARLKADARLHGQSMEEEVRTILRAHLAAERGGGSTNWVDAIRALVEPLGGVDLPPIERELVGKPPELGDTGSDVAT